MRNTARIVMGAAVVGLIAGTPVRGAWESWRGPNGNWQVTAPSWDPQAVAGRLRVVWRSEVGRGHSSMAVRGDRLYTMGLRTSGSGARRVAEEIVYCLSVKTGREIWRYGYPTVERNWPGPAATPVLDGDRLYTIGRGGEVYCLNAASGAVVWRRSLAEEKLAGTPYWGFCSSPVVDGNLLLLNGGSAGLALNKRTGKVVWSSGTVAGALSTPMIIERSGARRAVVASDSTISGIDVGTGKVRWSQRWDASADPILLGDRLLLTGGGRAKASMLLRVNGAAPKALWSSRHLGGTFQSAVVIDGYAYGFGRGNRNQMLECVDVATGELKWSQDMGGWGALIAVNKSLLIAEGDGDFVVAAASPVAFHASARLNAIPMTAAEKNGDNDNLRAVWTAPVFDGGRIFVRDNFGALVCIAAGS